MAIKRTRIEVRGAVQGVGFRPTVYRYAREAGLSGFVTNNSSGVVVEVEGPAEACAAFARRLEAEPPPAAAIREFAVSELSPRGETGFVIRESGAAAESFISIPPDLNTCADCRRELFDPADRRWRYPFINCTNCGPRFTITRTMPYDRPQTTMSAFPMCAQCAAEYHDPADRRFHAQPVACPQCGPRVWLETGEKGVRNLLCRAPEGPFRQKVPDTFFSPEGDAAVAAARELLASGKILAIRGLGGFHLACDALNPEAVERLRERKGRPAKPLAAMCPDLAAAEGLVELGAEERRILLSPLRPIVLARARPEAGALLESLAPGNSRLGLMLPYTPLHALVFEPAEAHGAPARFLALVMTSGNRRDEPICRTNQEALANLAGIADGWLLHDREIHNRADDSIVMVAAGAGRVTRRARGFVPRPVRLLRGEGGGAQTVLALGAEMKGAFCLLRGEQAYLSQYLGELDEAGNVEFYREALARFMALAGEPPAVLAHDLHPDYFTTRLARQWPGELAADLAAAGLKAPPPPERLLAVQHHQAHALSVLAELAEAAPETALAIILDGTGWGLDGTIWGGELLLVADGGARFERLAHLAPIRLAGGDKAAEEPWRPALALALRAFGDALPAELSARFEAAAGGADRLGLVRRALSRGVNAPLSSSAGRLFDAAGFLVTGRARVSFEAQAAIELESLAERCRTPVEPYGFSFCEVRDAPFTLDPLDAVRRMIEDAAAGRPAGEMAAAFHAGLARGWAALAARLAESSGIRDVLLSGGCFQNRLLLELLAGELERRGLRWYANREAPANDAGVALGQALAAVRTKGS